MTDTYTTYLIGDIRVHARGGPPDLRALVERYHYLCLLIDPVQPVRVIKSTGPDRVGPRGAYRRKAVERV